MDITLRNIIRLVGLLCLPGLSCRDSGTPVAPVMAEMISSDQQLFAFITIKDPNVSYKLFPNADSVAAGTLNGSNAHQPMVRVSLNGKALGALQDGQLQGGSTFPDGSVILKEVRINGSADLLAIVYKESHNPLSNGGWLWAELRPDGTVAYSIRNRGDGCISCHSREQGPQHDYIRTFERQKP